MLSLSLPLSSFILKTAKEFSDGKKVPVVRFKDTRNLGVVFCCCSHGAEHGLGLLIFLSPSVKSWDVKHWDFRRMSMCLP